MEIPPNEILVRETLTTCSVVTLPVRSRGNQSGKFSSKTCVELDNGIKCRLWDPEATQKNQSLEAHGRPKGGNFAGPVIQILSSCGKERQWESSVLKVAGKMMEQHREKNCSMAPVNLDARMRRDDPLRSIKERIDFDWMRSEGAPLMGKTFTSQPAGHGVIHLFLSLVMIDGVVES